MRRFPQRPWRFCLLTARRRRATGIIARAAFVSVFLTALSGCQIVSRFTAKPTQSPTPVVAVVAATSTPPAVPVADTVFDPKEFVEISPRGLGTRIPVIMYHDIVRKRGLPGGVYFDCTKAEFEAQIRWMEEQGAVPISLEQLHRHLTRGDEVPDKAIVLTFDDNYQGFYDIAYPILKERNYPSAMFVHTNFVGDKKGPHPKMSWETLRKLDKDGLVAIGSHTLSHPQLSKLSAEEQDRELVESKALLEQELGRPVPYFAYPEGDGDAVTFEAARRAGYTMAVTIENGPAEESPGILRIDRYLHTRLERAWRECQDAAVNAPAAVVEMNTSPAPVTLQVGEFAGTKLGLVRGGLPSTTQDPDGSRKSVGEFVALRAGAVAGMNGTFFANSQLRGTDNTMIGPCLTSQEGVFRPEADPTRLAKLRNRPFVLWGPTQIAIVPFNAAVMNDEVALRTFLPDMTDCFLGGAWIVHAGVARTRAEMQAYSARDFNDPRRRAFFGLTADGQVVLGGSLEVISTEKLAEAAAAAGVQEAVLMDSGFSTSIVFDNKIIVTGHTAKNLPSRPVPHSIVVTGEVEQPADPETVAVLKTASPAVGEISALEAQAQAPGPTHRRRRRRR
ncbi:MAG: polysaccharide deacetylase family protein [Cytophagales bacterium]|nr:polysaccharide deacetylase family protein [Armatimonadota bacterium]